MRGARVNALSSVLRTLGLALPFLLALLAVQKRVHMDDAAFLRVAEHVRSVPWDPYGFEWTYLGEPTSALVGMPHPPLWPALLAVGLELADGHLIGPRLIAVACAWLAALALLFPSSGCPIRLLWFAVLSPVFLVLSHNLMSDVAALTFGLLGLSLAHAAERRGSLLRFFLAGLALAAASGVRYVYLALPFCFLVFPTRHGRRNLVRACLILPAVWVFAFLQWNVFVSHGITHLEAILNHVRPEGRHAPELHALATLGYLGILAPAHVLLLPQGRGRWIVLMLALAGAACTHLALSRSSAVHGIQYDDLHVGLAFSLYACGGSLLGTLMTACGWRDPKARFALCLTLFACVTVVATPKGEARYVLPFILPLVELARARLAQVRLARAVPVLSLQALIALSMVLTDVRASRAYENVVHALPRTALATGRPGFVRGELGFRHVLEWRGYRYLSATDESPLARRFPPALRTGDPRCPHGMRGVSRQRWRRARSRCSRSRTRGLCACIRLTREPGSMATPPVCCRLPSPERHTIAFTWCACWKSVASSTSRKPSCTASTRASPRGNRTSRSRP